MKTFSFLLLLLGGCLAGGQDHALECGAPSANNCRDRAGVQGGVINGTSLLTFTYADKSADPCDGKVTFHGHSKKVREIFPEECGVPKPDCPYTDGKLCHAPAPSGSHHVNALEIYPFQTLDQPVEYHPAPAPPKDSAPDAATIRVEPVRWAQEDSGFSTAERCKDAPPDSPVVCGHSVKTWRGHCDDPGTVAILPLPPENPFYDWDAAHERGDKFWCVIVKQAEHCHIERWDEGYDPATANAPIRGIRIEPEPRKPSWQPANDLRIVCEGK